MVFSSKYFSEYIIDIEFGFFATAIQKEIIIIETSLNLA
jgi:hypothetical protein